MMKVYANSYAYFCCLALCLCITTQVWQSRVVAETGKAYSFKGSQESASTFTSQELQNALKQLEDGRDPNSVARAFARTINKYAKKGPSEKVEVQELEEFLSESLQANEQEKKADGAVRFVSTKKKMLVTFSAAALLFMGSSLLPSTIIKKDDLLQNYYGRCDNRHYDWVDILMDTNTEKLTELDSRDDDDLLVGVGFAPPFFGSNANTLNWYVSTNGLLSLFEQEADSNEPNLTLSPTEPPLGVVAPFWTDQKNASGSEKGSGIYILREEDRFIVSFIRMINYEKPKLPRSTYQLIFYRKGTIVFQYKTFHFYSGSGSIDCEVGLKNRSGTKVLAAIPSQTNGEYVRIVYMPSGEMQSDDLVRCLAHTD